MTGPGSGIEPADVPSGWHLAEGRLRREWRFADFAQAFAFMTAVAAEAERLDHHPDWSNAWNLVVIELRSHDLGRATERDLELARAIDAVASAAPGGTSCS